MCVCVCVSVYDILEVMLEVVLMVMAGSGSVGGFRGVGEDGRRAGEQRGEPYLGSLST